MENLSIFEQPDTRINIVKHPWRRLLARSFDSSLYTIILTLITVFVLRWNTGTGVLINWFEIALAGLLMLFIEPLLLSTIGTTPGKWIFGLVVRNKYGNKMAYSDALERTFLVIKHGMGFFIPVYNLFRNYRSYQDCMAGDELIWDESLSYEIKDVKGYRTLLYILGLILVFMVSVQIEFQSRLPINRGNITAIEYYENCNDFMDFNHLDLGSKLSNDGQWIRDDISINVHNISLTQLMDQKVVYRNGQIQKIQLSYETASDHFIYGFSNQMVMSYVSFVGAEKSINGKELLSDDVIDRFMITLDNFEFEKAGFRIRNTVEYSGYTGGSSFLVAEDDKDQMFSILFEIERLQ